MKLTRKDVGKTFVFNEIHNGDGIVSENILTSVGSVNVIAGGDRMKIVSRTEFCLTLKSYRYWHYDVKMYRKMEDIVLDDELSGLKKWFREYNARLIYRDVKKLTISQLRAIREIIEG